MYCQNLKEKLLTLKGSLNEVDSGLKGQMSDLELLEEKWKIMDLEAVDLSKNHQVITINVGGVEFQTTLKTLLNVKDTMFYKLVISNTFDLSKEIYFDRSSRYFSNILDFLRYQKIDFKRFNSDQQLELLEEANYYELSAMIDVLGERTKIIEFVNLEVSSHFMRNNTMVATGRLEDLKDRSLMGGIATNSPGWILAELNNDWEINEIEIGGFAGNTRYFAAENGANAKIQTSMNKSTWNTVGNIPSGFGSVSKRVKLQPTTARYIKFVATGHLGIGFLDIIKA